jgi:Glycosyl transferases group 1
MTDRIVLFVSTPGAAPIGVGLTIAQVRALEARGVHPRFIDHADPALPGVLAELGRHQPVVVADGDAAALDLLAPTVRECGARFLWWDRGRRTETPDAADGVDAPDVPVDGVLVTWPGPAAAPTTPTWIVGAGLDMRDFGDAVASPPPRPPFELALLGRQADSAALLVVLRSVARVRGTGVNAHLTVCATDAEDAIDPTILDLFAQDFALGDSVVARGGAVTVEAMGGFHAFVDASNTESPDRALLEAMARGIPVLSSNVGLASLLDGAPVPLTFRPTDAPQLAERIVELSRTWIQQLAELGVALRAAVAARHSIDVWADALLAALEERTVPVDAAAPALVVAASPPAVRTPDPDPIPVAAMARLLRVGHSLPWRQAFVAAALAVGTAVGVYAVVGTGGGDRVVLPDVQVVDPTSTTLTIAPSGSPTVAGATVTAGPATTSAPAGSKVARAGARAEAAADTGSDTGDAASSPTSPVHAPSSPATTTTPVPVTTTTIEPTATTTTIEPATTTTTQPPPLPVSDLLPAPAS